MTSCQPSDAKVVNPTRKERYVLSNRGERFSETPR